MPGRQRSGQEYLCRRGLESDGFNGISLGVGVGVVRFETADRKNGTRFPRMNLDGVIFQGMGKDLAFPKPLDFANIDFLVAV